MAEHAREKVESDRSHAIGASYKCWEPRRLKPMEKDVVCGMQVDPKKAAGQSEYQGKTYYFCAPECKKKFDANPQQFIAK